MSDITTAVSSEVPVFVAGDWVIYRGSVSRFNGWAMRVVSVGEHGRYSLESLWGVRLDRVRATSVTADPLGE